MTKRTLLLLAALTAASLALNLAGIRAPLPSPEQARLVFPEPEMLSALSPLMKSLRDEVYETYRRTDGVEVLKTYEPDDDTVLVKTGNGTLAVSRKKVHALRSVFLQNRLPDGQQTITALSNIRPDKRQFNPHLFHYGGAYLYSAGAAVKLASLFGLAAVTSDTEHYFRHPEDSGTLFALIIGWGALFGTIAVALAFLCGARFFGAPAGLLAAAFLAFAPSVITEAHSPKPYVFFFPFMLLALLFSRELLRGGRKRHYLLAGLAAGLAAGSLVLSGTVLFSALLAHYFRCRDGKERLLGANLALLLTSAAAAFLLTNPFWALSFPEVRDLFAHLGRQAPFHFSLPRMFHHFFIELPALLGNALYPLAVAGLALALVSRRREDWLLLAAFLPFYFYTSNTHWNAPHYAMPLVPLAALFAARFAVFLGNKLAWRPLYKAALALVIVFTFGNALYYDLLLLRDRHLLEAGRWINENLPRGSSVGTASYPYFGFGGYPPFALLNYRVNETPDPAYYIALGDNDPALSDETFRRSYAFVQSFERPGVFLDALYTDRLLYFLKAPVRVYRRRAKDGETLLPGSLAGMTNKPEIMYNNTAI